MFICLFMVYHRSVFEWFIIISYHWHQCFVFYIYLQPNWRIALLMCIHLAWCEIKEKYSIIYFFVHSFECFRILFCLSLQLIIGTRGWQSTQYKCFQHLYALHRNAYQITPHIWFWCSPLGIISPVSPLLYQRLWLLHLFAKPHLELSRLISLGLGSNSII